MEEENKILKERIRSLENKIEKQQKMIEQFVQSEKKFQARENLWKQLLGKKQGIMYSGRVDEEFIIDKVSYDAEYITGYSQQELLGKRKDNLNSLIKVEERKNVWETIQKSLQQNGEYEIDFHLITKSGKEKFVCEKGYLVQGNSENEVLFEGVIFELNSNGYKENIKNIFPKTLYELQDGLCEIDVKKEEYLFSSKFLKLLDYEKKEYQPEFEWFISKVHIEDKRNVSDKIRLIVDSVLEKEEFNFRMLKKDKTYIWLKAVIKICEFDNHRFPLKILMVFTDISSSKDIEGKLKNNLRMFELLLETIPVPIFYKNKNGVYKGCNQAFVDQIGIPKEKLIGSTVFDLYPRELAKIYFEADKELFQSGGVQRYEAKVRDKFENTKDVIFYKSVFTGQEDETLGLIGVYLDITEKNKIGKELAEQQEFLESILSRLPLVLTRVNSKGVFLFSDGEGLRKLGLVPGEVVGVSAFDLYSEYPEIIKQLKRVLKGERFVDKVHIDNLCFEVYYTPLFDSDRRVEGALVVALDITLRAEVEKEVKLYINRLKENKKLVETQVEEISQKNILLEESENKLKKLNDSKDLFFSIIAHDLKNPFTSLIGLADMLQDASKSCIKDENSEIIDILNRNIKQVYNLLEELLEWGALQLGKTEYQPEEINLLDVVKNVSVYLKESYKMKKISVILNIDREQKVFADEKMLETILRNLISNSIKFTNRYGEILISAESDNVRTIVSVKDNGIGIPKEDINKLFRIDGNYSTTGLEGEKGTGMGLILCKELIEKNNGTIWVESAPDKGSNFLFTLFNSENIRTENFKRENLV
ncbi:MAG: PAS domain S-box protein [Rhodothermaceae bacterium]